jgi:hypothetical protein
MGECFSNEDLSGIWGKVKSRKPAKRKGCKKGVRLDGTAFTDWNKRFCIDNEEKKTKKGKGHAVPPVSSVR